MDWKGLDSESYASEGPESSCPNSPDSLDTIPVKKSRREIKENCSEPRVTTSEEVDIGRSAAILTTENVTVTLPQSLSVSSSVNENDLTIPVCKPIPLVFTMANSEAVDVPMSVSQAISLSMPNCNETLEEEDIDGDKAAFCKSCLCTIPCRVEDLTAHMQSSEHMKKCKDSTKPFSFTSGQDPNPAIQINIRPNNKVGVPKEVTRHPAKKSGMVSGLEEKKQELEYIKLKNEIDKLHSEKQKIEKETEIREIQFRKGILEEQKLKLEVEKLQLEKEKLKSDNQTAYQNPIQFVTVGRLS